MFIIRSLRSKFILIVISVILVVLGTSTFFEISRKRGEITTDMFRKAVSFTELASQPILDSYLQDYATNNFIKVPGRVRNMLDLNKDITNVQVFDYEGTLLYDFAGEQTTQYAGPIRKNEGRLFINRLQDRLLSINTEDEKIVFVRTNEAGVPTYVDDNGISLASENSEAKKIQDLILPITTLQGKSYALRYFISYSTLDGRLMATITTTGVISLISIVFAVFFAFIFSGGLIRPLNILTEKARRIASGNFGETISLRTNDEVGRLADSFNHMSQALKSTTDSLLEKERFGKEIELASQIQAEFLPKKIPDMGGLDIHAGVLSAEAVGGDCYDFVQLTEDTLLFYIGDVTGHGVSAGLVTAIVNSLIYSQTLEEGQMDLKHITVMLNKVLRMKTRPDMFITLFLGIWNSKKGSLQFIPCGHEPGYIYSEDKKTVTPLIKRGIALGMLDRIDNLISLEEVALAKGDSLILYTDGIPEAWSPTKDQYGFKRFEESIKRHADKTTAKQLYDGIIEDVYLHMGNRPQSDDVSLVILKRNN